MSWTSLKLKPWERNGERRVYVDARFVDGRDLLSWAHDACFYEDAGRLNWRPGFRCGPETVRRTEMMHLAMTDERNGLLAWLNCETMDELLAAITANQTRGGNFSATQFERSRTTREGGN